MLNSGTAYSFLVSLYSYAIIVLLGFLVSGGLLYVKFDKRREWKTISEANFHPWLDPLHAIIYFAGTGFFMFAAFAKPAADSPFSTKYQQYAWYLMPAKEFKSQSTRETLSRRVKSSTVHVLRQPIKRQHARSRRPSSPAIGPH
jgi:hypothetical protein